MKEKEIKIKLKIPFLYRIAIWWIASRTAKRFDIWKEEFSDQEPIYGYYMTKYGLFYGLPFSPIFSRSEITLNSQFLEEWFDKKI